MDITGILEDLTGGSTLGDLISGILGSGSGGSSSSSGGGTILPPASPLQTYLPYILIGFGVLLVLKVLK